MFRLVANTNISVSATSFLSPSLLQEVEGVLLDKFDWSAPRARGAVTAIRGFAALVLPTDRVAVITNDEPDNRILECALAAQAERIVSGDHHLQQLKTFQGIPIQSPREFLDSQAWVSPPPNESG